MKTTQQILLIFLFGFLLFACCEPEDTVSSSAAAIKKDSVVLAEIYAETIDMEDINDTRVTTSVFSSGKKSNVLNNESEYGISFKKSWKDIASFNSIQKLMVDVKSYSKNKIKDAVLVVSVDNEKEQKNIFWDGKPLGSEPLGSWITNSFTYEIKPEFLSPDYTISVYAWNKSKETFYVDDISIVFVGAVKANTNISDCNFFYDFETTDGIVDAASIKPSIAHSGKNAADLTGGQEYGPAIVKLVKEITTDSLKKISASIWVYPTEANPDLVLTASCTDDKTNQPIFWEGESTLASVFPINTWTKLNASFSVPASKLNPENKIRVSAWNKGKTNVLLDDLEIVYNTPPQRKGSASSVDPASVYERRFTPTKNVPPFDFIYLNKQPFNLDLLKNQIASDDCIGGDFIKNNNLDEVLCIQKNSASLFSFSTSKKTLELVWETKNTNEVLLNNDYRRFSGDFNADGAADLLLINSKNGSWQLLNFINKQWNTTIIGKTALAEKWFNTKNNISSVSFFTKQKDALVITTNKGISVLQLANNVFVEKDVSGYNPVVFNSNDLFFEIGSGSNEIIKLNTGWRFDVKLISNINNEYIIKNMIDFKGYENDYNPKYYEFNKIISGNFTNNHSSELLVFSCNCNDSNFDGKKCNTIENVSYLPNTIAIYSLDKK